MKTCKRCQMDMPETEFYRTGYKRNDGTYGLKAICKECEKARTNEHYHANKDKYADAKKQWAENNQEKVKASRRKYAKAHPEKMREKCREYYQRHKAKRAEQNRRKAKAWAKANPEKVRARETRDIANLGDRYIRRTIASLSTLKMSQIPQAMVEVKRLQLMIKREIENEECN